MSHLFLYYSLFFCVLLTLLQNNVFVDAYVNKNSQRLISFSTPSTSSSTSINSSPLSSTTVSYNTPANALIRKAKMREVEALRRQVALEGDASPINQFFKTNAFEDKYGKPVPFIESVKNRFSSITVMPEYSKKVKTGFILGMPEPEIMGTVLRDAGAKAVVVCLDKRTGGASEEEFVRFVADQSRSR